MRGYLPGGHLVFARGGLVFAARFDARRVEVTSSTVPGLQGVRRSAVNGTAHFSVSDTGSLIYLPGPTGLGERRVDLVLTDRNGAVERVPLPPGPDASTPRAGSPDGRLLAFGTTGQDQDISAPRFARVDGGAAPDVWWKEQISDMVRRWATGRVSNRIVNERWRSTGRPQMAAALLNA